ncbi:MAG: ABC transporter ATP-binding protein, partial [Planktothrix sp.]
ITILVFTGLLLSISWQLTLISIFLLSLVVLFNQIFIRRAKKWGEKLSNASRDYAISIIETLNGIRLVKSMGHENREYEKITKLISKLEKSTYKSDLNYAIISPINEVISIIVILLIVISGRFIFANNIQAFSAILLTYLFLLFRTLPLVSSLNNARSQFANNSAGVAMVEDLLRRDNKPFMAPGTLPYNSFEKGIHFNNISFGYPEHDNLVLKNIDLYIPRGTTLALVGGSGAGKSTLADLLPRFYDPNEGSIEIDGLDIREYNLQSLRQAMGVVSQDTFLFNSSIRDNIAYARPEATDEEIIEASKRANAHEFIDRLPEGFDTLIGDRGVLLSGGQRQRLSIARALLRNPEILILDEATSALDTVSERLVQEAIDALSRERTTIVIAHRLSTVQSAHQIAVLDQGEVVELGTHDELLKLGGHFARLYTLQFAEEAARDEALIQSSYEVRTRLNPMIGFLRLLIDGMADTPEEQEELLLEAYRSATSIFKNIEFIEQSVKLRLKKQ